MLSLLKRPPAPPPAPAAVPDGRRVYAIGDVHGRADLLDRLLDRIEADDAGRNPAAVTLVLLGDLVDRGPASAQVVARAAALARAGDVQAIMGNHEEVMVRALAGDPRAVSLFLQIGGVETMESYGVTLEQLAATDEDGRWQLISQAVPIDHRAFLEGMGERVAIGDYLFVHAGIRPGVALDRQKAADLRWIRQPFLDSPRFHGAMVVHGHSISDEPELLANRIGIDTGAFATGTLTALGLEGTDRWLIQAKAP